LEKAGVVVIPGNAFGAQGEGYVRIALVKPVDVLKDVILRIKESGILFA
jgi:LL-diaminopimelate aminotransferase